MSILGNALQRIQGIRQPGLLPGRKVLPPPPYPVVVTPLNQPLGLNPRPPPDELRRLRELVQTPRF